MQTVTDSVVLEFMDEHLRPAVKKGDVYDRDTLDEAYSEHLNDLVSLKTPGAVVEENGNFDFSGTMIADEVVGMYFAYDLVFDMALEILKEKIEQEIKEEDLLDLE